MKDVISLDHEEVVHPPQKPVLKFTAIAPGSRKVLLSTDEEIWFTDKRSQGQNLGNQIFIVMEQTNHYAEAAHLRKLAWWKKVLPWNWRDKGYVIIKDYFFVCKLVMAYSERDLPTCDTLGTAEIAGSVLAAKVLAQRANNSRRE
ncbi:MAG: hypothetical protein KGJ93_00575 [Patescibacteria group bacterium]|nr:hypothetical protein [Patescibacteria group bacterium]